MLRDKGEKFFLCIYIVFDYVVHGWETASMHFPEVDEENSLDRREKLFPLEWCEKEDVKVQ